MKGRRTVVVVEDDPDLLRFAQVTLRLGGYRVLTATDGQQALAVARKARPDLLVLDLRLPLLDGWQVLDSLKADPGLRTVPVVVVTASADNWGKDRALAAGVVVYLVKPISADDLLAAVERALSGQQQAPEAPPSSG